MKLCEIIFIASPSRTLVNSITGGCVLGRRGIKAMCKKCKNYNTRNYIEEGRQEMLKLIRDNKQ